MPKALLLNNGYVISERDESIEIKSNFDNNIWIVINTGHRSISQIPVDAVFYVHVNELRGNLPCSTYFLQSSSPANSQPATTFHIPNTPTTPPHVLVFLQESLASLEAQVGSIRKFLAATCQQ